MFCPKCGKNLEDDSNFCSYCGMNLTECLNQPEDVEEYTEKEEKEEEKESVDTVRKIVPSDIKGKHRRKGARKIGIAAILFVFAVFIIKGLFFSVPDEDNAYAYLYNGRYKLVSSQKKGKAVDLDSDRLGSVDPLAVSFSPDGKYVYYFTMFDNDSQTGSLCRAEYNKLKKDPEKNSSCFEIVATDVQMNIDFLEDGSVLYRKKDGALQYYNGEEIFRVAENVVRYYTDGDSRIVYFTGNYDDDMQLYGVSTKDMDSRKLLSSDFYHVLDYGNVDDFICMKYDNASGDYKTDLYSMGYDKAPEMIGKDVYVYNETSDRVYFTAVDGKKIVLYDYVSDPEGENDRSAERNALRDTLKDEKNAYPLKTLYYYSGGEKQVVDENVLSVQCIGDLILFNTVDQVDKIDFKDVTSPEDVSDLFWIDYRKQNYFIVGTDGEKLRMSESAASVLTEVMDDVYPQAYIEGSVVYLRYESNLLAGEIKNGTVEKFSIISDDAYSLQRAGGNIYYLSSGYAESGYLCYDLYVCREGKPKQVVEHVRREEINIYEDGMILAATKYTGDYDFELSMVSANGAEKIIADHVTRFIRVRDSSVLYISDGDIWFCDGKKNRKLQQDVAQVWSRDQVEPELIYHEYDFPG